MKQGSTFFLKVIICLIGVAALMALIWFPQTEGRAAGLDLISIYTDPLIVYSYIASIPFFVGLYQAIKLLHLIDANNVFSKSAVTTLKYMKVASFSLIGFIALALLYIRFFAYGDDVAGATMLGICVSLAFCVIGTAAGVFQKLLQNAVDMKTEHDLTV